MGANHNWVEHYSRYTVSRITNLGYYFDAIIHKVIFRPRKKKTVLRARPTAFSPFADFFFFFNKEILKSAVFWTQI